MRVVKPTVRKLIRRSVTEADGAILRDSRSTTDLVRADIKVLTARTKV
jgi:hypothetical protein